MGESLRIARAERSIGRQPETVCADLASGCEKDRSGDPYGAHFAPPFTVLPEMSQSTSIHTATTLIEKV